MPTPRLLVVRLAALAFLVAVAPGLALAEGPGLGQPLDKAEIPFYALYTMPDGTGLPPGAGTAREGADIYAEQCAACHGESGREGPIMPPVGPSETYDKPAGSYWPYATTLFDYIRRAMPFQAPKSLADEEVYAVTAFILHQNGLVAEDATIDADTLPKVQMPNRDSFIDLWARQGDKPY